MFNLPEVNIFFFGVGVSRA